MGFDVRLQLVDRRSLWTVIEALAADTALPASAFDRGPEAAAQWDWARAAWTRGDDAAAASAACWFCVLWSAASLPAVVLRNVALTHRPIRMPDVYGALDLPSLAAPRSIFEGVAGVRAGIVAALPRRLDTGAQTGAFISDPDKAGAAVARFLATHLDAEPERRTLSKIVALFRAAERAELQVWEAIDGAPVVAAAPGHATALVWPGLSRSVLETPLSESEWAAVDGSWLRTTLGDLEDIVTVAERVAPDDARLVPLVCQALRQAFRPQRMTPGGRRRPFVDDLLPRGLAWLERTLVVPSHAGVGLLAYAALERCFLNRVSPRSLPPDAWTAAAESGTSEDLEAFERCARERGPVARGALARLVERLSTTPPSTSADTLQSELRVLYEMYRRGPIPDPIARMVAERWYALYCAAPERARNSQISDYVLDDSGPCGHLLERLLGPAPAPSLALARMIRDLFEITPDCPRDASLFPSTVRANLPTLREIAEAARSLGDEKVARTVADWCTRFEHKDDDDDEDEDDDEFDVPDVPDAPDDAPPANTSPAVRAEVVVANWHLMSRDEYVVVNQMVDAGHGALLAAAFLRWLATHPAPKVLTSLTMRLTFTLNIRGLIDPAAFDLCIDIARRAFAEFPNANFLYNAACAHVRRGEIERAAAVLAEAIAIDPTQADDVRKDADFQPHLGHPAFVRILGS